MAKITYADKIALNENPNVNAINKVRDVDMNEIKEVINNNETKVLLAVSSSAPATCDTGDIYFNTTDNLIYTATATDTWGSTGVAPTENTIYIEFTSQTLYAYDGTTLVSVGGGASGGGETLSIGTVLEFPSTDSTKVPDGWLFCDGSAVSRTTYADLFAIIGTSFGAGDGSTTFNLPTKEGLVSVGIDTNDTDFNTIGKTGGSKYLQEHKHKWANDNGRSYAGAYGWNYSAPASGSNFPGVDDTSPNTGGVLTTGTGGVQTGNSGNLQPYTVTNYIIKATQTTPIQAEVVNDYSTSQENAYSCDYVNDTFGETVLYNNASGSNATSITLSDSAANYNYIEIFYRSNDNVYSSLKVDSPNTKLINLTAFYAGGADIYNNSCNYTINGTSITRGTGVSWYILSNTTVSSSNAYNIYITKVIGYK